MKKSFIFLSLFLICFSLLFGYQLTLVSESESNRIALNWVSFINKIPLKDKLGKYKINFIKKVTYKGNVLCEIYHLSPEGHILVPSYKEFPPIKSFSVVSDFDSTSKGYEFVVLKELKSSFRFLHDYSSGEIGSLDLAISKTHNRWKKFLQMDLEKDEIQRLLISENKNSKKRSFMLKDKYEVQLKTLEAYPLIETRWGQGEPFWNWCPLLNGERCYVGCTNTAMAQIMRFYKWPKNGEGEHSYYWGNGGKWLGADFSDPYDWEYMPNEYWDYDTNREKEAVAELCYEIGVSNDTGFHHEGSPAGFREVVYSLKNYFKYSNSVKYVARRNYGSVDEWFDILKSQRDSMRPLEFGMFGYDENENEYFGHAVVVDGYLITSGSKKIHINMGWYGSYDAYYTLDNILDYTENYWQDAVIDIIPPKYFLTIITGKGGTTEP